MPKHKSEDYKLSSVNYLTENNNELLTCKIFKCSRRSLMRWVNKYKEEIPKTIFTNIFKGSYERNIEKIKKKTRKIKRKNYL